MRIVMATEMSDEPFASFSFDGVVGLGLDALALTPEFSFFGVLASQGRLAQPTFGVFLADSDDDFSEISFGGHNPTRLKSDLAWSAVALPELGHWQVRILEIRIGNKTLDFCNDGECRAVVDTGTSLLVVPHSFMSPLYDMLEESLQDPPASTTGMVDCRKASGELLEFVLETSTLELGPGDYTRAAIQLGADADELTEDAATAVLAGDAPSKVDSSIEHTGVSNGNHDAASCHPTLMPIDLAPPLGPKLFIFGEPVLRKYYTAYDWAQKQIGFGLAAHLHQDTAAVEESKPLKPLKPLLLLQVNFAVKLTRRSASPCRAPPALPL